MTSRPWYISVHEHLGAGDHVIYLARLCVHSCAFPGLQDRLLSGAPESSGPDDLGPQGGDTALPLPVAGDVVDPQESHFYSADIAASVRQGHQATIDISPLGACGRTVGMTLRMEVT